jgi:hypothetical protein
MICIVVSVKTGFVVGVGVFVSVGVSVGVDIGVFVGVSVGENMVTDESLTNTYVASITTIISANTKNFVLFMMLNHSP